MAIAVIGFFLFVMSFFFRGLNDQTGERTNLQPLAWSSRALGLLMLIGGLFYAMIVIVPAGHRAVLLKFGAVAGQLDEGMSMIMPGVYSTVLVEVRTQKEDSQASAASKDLQTVTTNLALNFRVDSSQVSRLYQRVGTEYKGRIIDPAVQESLKVVTAQFTAEELIKLRQTVKTQVETEMTRRLKAYDILVEPGGLSITNFDFSPEFKKAIEEKQVAQQMAEKQKYVLQQAELEKQTEIARAEGTSQAAKLNAEALKVQGGSLVVMREWIEKWDGKLPSVAGSGNFMFDLSKLMDAPR